MTLAVSFQQTASSAAETRSASAYCIVVRRSVGSGLRLGDELLLTTVSATRRPSASYP